MAEMLLHTPESKYVVDDYDFTFLNGMVLPVTVNEKLGDTVQFFGPDGVIVIHLAAKPSLNDPAIFLPVEDITIYRQHLVTHQHRVREVTDLAPEQQYAWAKTLKDLSKTIQ